MKEHVAKNYGCWLVLLFCVFYVCKAVVFPAHDFSNYYYGGKFLWEGKFTSSLYFPYEFNKAIAATGQKGVFASYAPNTPFIAFLFYPIALLPLALAKILFNVASVLLFIFSLRRLVAFYQIGQLYVALIVVVFFIPIKNELLFGQVYFLLFFLLGECWLAYQKSQWHKMAIFLSLAILLKVFPVLLLLLFLFKKQFRAAGFVLLFTGILMLISSFFTGIDIWFFYLKEVLPKASNGEIATSFVPNYQSVFMFLKQLLIYGCSENNIFWNFPAVFSVMVITSKILLLTIGYFVSKKVKDSFLVLSYWIFMMLLMSPYGSTYTLIMVLFVFLHLMQAKISAWKKASIVTLFFFANNLPVSVFINYPFPFSYMRLLLMLVLFGVLMTAVYGVVNRKAILSISVLSLLLSAILPDSAERGNDFDLGRDKPILIYDYALADHQLTYFYWNENGAMRKSMPLEFSSVKSLTLKNNQIFYNNKPLETDDSNKRKPVLIDNHIIVYLSDFDRGIGFYTLRQMTLP